MKKQNYPKYLYHYTSVNTLSQILMNKKIRFNSLINVDDPEEIKTIETEGIGKYCYCSCWTDLYDSIPFWKMYGNNTHGVMIKMKVFPFLIHQEYLEYFDNGRMTDTIVPKEIFDEGKQYIIPTIPILRKVEYIPKKNINAIYYCKENEDGTYDIKGNFNNIGAYKNKTWSFQSEWRYSFILIPHDKHGRITIDVGKGKDKLISEYYDVDISDDAIRTMEIILGPNITQEDENKVKLICLKYASTAKIYRSSVLISVND